MSIPFRFDPLGSQILNPLTFTCSSGSVKLTESSNYQYDGSSDLYYNNGYGWRHYEIDQEISFADTGKVSFYNSNENFSGLRFILPNSTTYASGNIMSLMNYSNRCKQNCFNSLFSNQSYLTTAPELPAMNLAESCYRSMFYDCSNLTTAPKLPAMNLAERCYEYMFSYCSSLTTAPELPAMNLATYCYKHMFFNCSSLTTVPELPAMNLAIRCYQDMFFYCSCLNYIKVNFTNWNGSATENWVKIVSSTGRFIVPNNFESSAEIYDDSHIPVGWTLRRIG